MKKVPYHSMTARATIGALFFVAGIFLIVFGLFTARLHSAMPNAGTLNSGGPAVNWVGTAAGGTSVDESTCVEGVNCDTFVLTLSGTRTNWTGLKARIVISCADPSGLIVFGLFTARLHSAMPNAGTLNSGGPAVNWVGTAAGGTSVDESTCVEGVNCDTFVLTLSGTRTNWTGLKARIVISCADPSG